MPHKKEELKTVKVLDTTHQILLKLVVQSKKEKTKETIPSLIDTAVRGFYKPNKSLIY